MDLTKLGGFSWNDSEESKIINLPSQSIKSFVQEASNSKLTNSIGDLLSLTRSRTGRQFAAEDGDQRHLKHSYSTSILQQINGTTMNATGATNGGTKTMKSLRVKRTLPGIAYNVTERPPNREEIASLEHELEERVRSVLYPVESNMEAFETGQMHRPHKDAVTVMRNKVLKKLNIHEEEFSSEPWLDRLIQCECLQITCDEVAKKLIDMLGVTTSELGNVLRKLRLSNQQTFNQVRSNWQYLRDAYLTTQNELRDCKDEILSLRSDLDAREEDVEKRITDEVNSLRSEFDIEKKNDHGLLCQSELKIEQLSDTLSSLNGIFKAMQADANAIRTADVVNKCQRLEIENAELQARCTYLEKSSAELKLVKDKLKTVEMDLKLRDAELLLEKQNLQRREEVVARLMEKEAIRDAEIEALQKQIHNHENPTDVLEFQEPATAVLCIKCKKSLDDLSNIRAAVIGSNGNGKKTPCENFRILLPNLRGKRPHRNQDWLRVAFRCILLSKVKEDVTLLGFKGESSRFPQFVYSWFERPYEGLTGAALTTAHTHADEDRWGFYYSLKSLSKDDPEAMLFWVLLDETQGEDGLQFVCHCLSVIMSMSGSELWKQLGWSILNKGASISTLQINEVLIKEKVKQNIWVDVQVAFGAVRMILARALKSHLIDALAAVDALRAMPDFDPEVTAVNDTSDVPVAATPTDKDNEIDAHARLVGATHIDLFMWLRIMLQFYHAEQIHRAAAIRLMFEAASVGALTPQVPTSTLDKDNLGANGSQVEFPQFMSIVRTIFPSVSTTETASLFALCYDEGKKKVTADVFIKIADRKGLFSRAMRLRTLPLLEQHTPAYKAIDIHDANGGIDASTIAAEYEEHLTPVEEMTKESMLRVNLGSLIHRKVAAITPELNWMLRTIPERWKAMLTYAIEDVHAALSESYARMKKKFGQEDQTRKHHYIDGVQPYVQYRRLLSIALLVKSITDNPLVPSELFLSKNRCILSNINVNMQRAEKILSSMEESLISGSNLRDSVPYCKSKFYLFEQVRRQLVARKLQHKLRSFFNSDKVARIPRCVRLRMRAGYIRGIGNNPLKNREAVHKPWWTQSVISMVMAFKLDYDAKASRLNLPPILLADAVYALLYATYGSVDITERYIHDLFHCAHLYQLGSPRMLLFLSLLGVGIDDDVKGIWTSPYAIASYYQLLLEVHYQLSLAKHKKECSSKGSYHELEAAGILVVDGNAAVKKPVNPLLVTQKQVAQASDVAASIPSTDSIGNHATAAGPFNFYNEPIHILYPSSECGLSRPDQHDIWVCEATTLKAALRQWTKSNRSINADIGEDSIYIDMLDQLKPTQAGKVNVDQFLWLMTSQWTKLSLFYSKRSQSKADLCSKSGPVGKVKASIYSRDSFQTVDIVQLAPLPMEYLTQLAKSMYRANDGERLVDTSNLATLYLKHVVSKGIDHSIRSDPRAKKSDVSSSVMRKILCDTTLWDTNVGVTAGGNSGVGVISITNIPPISFPIPPVLLYELSLQSYVSYKDVYTLYLDKLGGDHSNDISKQMSLARSCISDIDALIEMNNSDVSIRKDGKSAKQLQRLFSQLSSSINLLVISQRSCEYPCDAWKHGYQLTLDSCTAYNITQAMSPY